MSAERDAGLAALRNGNAAEAIPYLERAASSAPNDLQTLLPLGAAYGQMGRHADAVRTVMQAVTLQPSNAEARYGLAAAYANAGHREYALTAAQQALQLQPDYLQARELAARLSEAPEAHSLPGKAAEASSYGQPASPASYGQAQPLPSGQSQAPYGRQDPTGAPMTGGYGSDRTATPYGAPGGAPAPPQASRGSYQGQGAAAYGGSPPATYYNPPPRPGFVQQPDNFDMKQAVTDWVRVIREPNAFFREQAERTGYNAPLAFLVAFGIAVGVFAIISGLIRLALSPSSVTAVLFQIVVGATGGITGALMGAFVWGGVLHVVGRMFGNRQPYHKTFRVAAYSRAPLLFFSAVTSLIVPFIMPVSGFTPRSTGTPSPFGQMTSVQFTVPTSPSGLPGGTTQPGSGRTRTPNPFDDPNFQKAIGAYKIIGPLSILGLIWVWCLQAIGLKYAQNLSSGGAAGTVFVALLIPFLLLVLFVVLFGLLIVGLMGASRGASGFQNLLSLVPSSLAVWRGI